MEIFEILDIFDVTLNCFSSTDIFSYLNEDELINMTKSWSGYQGNCLKDPIKCYGFVTNDFCLRANTLPSYLYINRQVMFFAELLPNNCVEEQFNDFSVVLG